MTIVVNGESLTVNAGATVEALLASLQQQHKRVVVELNRQILDKNAYGIKTLTEGDSLEIIQFVPGG